MGDAIQLELFVGPSEPPDRNRRHNIGDIVVKQDQRRYLVTHVSSDIHGPVYVCVDLATGGTSVVLAREVAFRGRALNGATNRAFCVDSYNLNH